VARIGVLALTLVGLAIRAWDLGVAGVWFDESYHVALVREPTVGAMLDAILSNPPSDPLYALVLRAWVAVAGSGDAAIRVPSVLAGSLTIPAAAWLAREADGRRAVVLVAAAFVALSPYALEFSQEAAPYALAGLVTTAALAAGWRWRRTGAGRDGAIAVGLAVVAVYAHYVVPVFLGLVWLIGLTPWAGSSRVRPRAWAIAGGIVALAWLPWLVALAGHWLASAAPRASLESPIAVGDLPRTLGQYAAGTAALLQSQRLLVWGGLGLGIVLVALGWLAGLDPARRGLRVVALAAGIVFAAPALAAMATGRWLFVPHFGLLTLPAVLVVAAAGVAHVGELRPGSRRPTGRVAAGIAGGLAAALCAVAIAGIGQFRAHPPHGADGLRELVRAIEGGAAADDPVLVDPAILTPSLAQYTSRQLTGIPEGFDLRNLYTPYARPASDDVLRAAVRAAVAGHDRVWLVTREELQPYGVIVVEIERSFTERSRLRMEFGTLVLYETGG
jgi:4-amino-4-deoxy-L-arabinose transferase-like glycosyltransferase